MSETVFLDRRPAALVTSARVVIGGVELPTDRVYSAGVRRAARSWWRPATWWHPGYVVRVLTADGVVALPAGTDGPAAEDLAAAVNQAIRPAHWI